MESVHEFRFTHQEQERQAEGDQTLEFVNEATRRFLALFMGQEAGYGHAKGIDHDGDRDRRRDQYELKGQVVSSEEVGEDDTQSQKGHQRAKATAGFRDEEVASGKMNDVPVTGLPLGI